MEKQDNNMTRSGGIDLDENHDLHQYSELFQDCLISYSKRAKVKVVDKNKIVNVRERLKGFDTLKARVFNLRHFNPKSFPIFACTGSLPKRARIAY